MKPRTFLLAGALLSVASSCGQPCDTLVFVDPHEQVEQDLLAMDALLRDVNSRCPAEYVLSFDEQEPVTIQVRDEKERTVLVNQAYFCDAAAVSRPRFYALAARLKRNEIRYVYRDVATGINVYGYCYTDYTEGDLSRHIILDEKDNRAAYGFSHKVLEKKGKLVLMALHDRD
jgi:hypothetical protein